jgi:hypothetical protein
MTSFLNAIIIGLVAGIIDIIPMIIQKINSRDIVSAFIHYLALGVIIPYVSWDICQWMKGSIIALLTSIPIMIIVYLRDKKAIVPMIVFSILLGAGIGYVGTQIV